MINKKEKNKLNQIMNYTTKIQTMNIKQMKKMVNMIYPKKKILKEEIYI